MQMQFSTDFYSLFIHFDRWQFNVCLGVIFVLFSLAFFWGGKDWTQYSKQPLFNFFTSKSAYLSCSDYYKASPSLFGVDVNPFRRSLAHFLSLPFVHFISILLPWFRCFSSKPKQAKPNRTVAVYNKLYTSHDDF